MMTKRPINKLPWLQRTSSMLTMLGLLVLTGLLLLTMVVSQKSIQESQDIRQEASVVNGKVKISASYPQEIVVGQETTIELKVDTGQVQVDGLQLVFDVVTEVADQITIDPKTEALLFVSTEVSRVQHGFNAEMIAITPNPEKPFSTSTPTTFAIIKFTPTKAGKITINFDTERSIAPIHKSYPIKDELTHVTPITIQANKAAVTDGRDNLYANTSDLASRFLFYKQDSNEQVNANNLKIGTFYIVKHQAEINNSVFNERSSDPTPIEVTLSAADSGLGRSNLSYSTILRDKNATRVNLETVFVVKDGDNKFTVSLDHQNAIDESNENDNQYSFTLRFANEDEDDEDDENNEVSDTCNDTCSSNSDCSINERCYDTGVDGKRCRLATNVNSSVCHNPPDQGLNRTCNEYCADANECSGNLTCWYNRCRDPYNVEDPSCPTLSENQTTQIREGCNVSCATNADCANNLRCYNGACRLATNPSSTTCTAATAGRLTASTTTTNSRQTAPLATPTVSSSLQPSASPSPSASASSKPIPTPIPTMTPTPPSIDDEVEIEESMLDMILGSVQGFFIDIADFIRSAIPGSDQTPETSAPEIDFDAAESTSIASEFPKRDFMSCLPFIIVGIGVIILIVVILKFLASIFSPHDDQLDNLEENPDRFGSTTIPWQPPQTPPQTHGHGITPPLKPSVSDHGVTGGINNPSEIEELKPDNKS